MLCNTMVLKWIVILIVIIAVTATRQNSTAAPYDLCHRLATHFIDSENVTVKTASNLTTIHSCLSRCEDFTVHNVTDYAGLDLTDSCHCLESSQLSPQLRGNDSECISLCKAQNSIICGGIHGYSVYHIESSDKNHLQEHAGSERLLDSNDNLLYSALGGGAGGALLVLSLSGIVIIYVRHRRRKRDAPLLQTERGQTLPSNSVLKESHDSAVYQSATSTLFRPPENSQLSNINLNDLSNKLGDSPPYKFRQPARFSVENPVYDDVYETSHNYQPKSPKDSADKNRQEMEKRGETYSYASTSQVSSRFCSTNTTLSQFTINEYEEETYSYSATNTISIRDSDQVTSRLAVSSAIYENYAESYLKPVTK